MPRKSKPAPKPRTNKQGSINMSGSLHQKVKEYCLQHSMTQVEFIEVSLKVLGFLPGDPRLWTADVPTPISQAIAKLQSAELAFREFMQSGRSAAPQQRVESQKPDVPNLKPRNETPPPSPSQSAPVQDPQPTTPAEGVNTIQKGYDMIYQSAQNKFDKFIPLTEAEQIMFIKHERCPQCGGLFRLRRSANGDFLGCSNYRYNGTGCDYAANGTIENPKIKEKYLQGVKRIILPGV